MKIRNLFALMPTLVATMAVNLVFASDTAPESSTARYIPKTYKTAVMSYGTYSSPMSSDRKVIIQTPDGTPVAEEIYSPNKRCYAYADLRGSITTVYENVMQENIGRRQTLWEMDGCREMVGLSDDGGYLIAGRRGDNQLPHDYDPEEIALSFYENGRLINEIRLNQLIADFAKLQPTESGYYWGEYLGLNAAGYYVVETVDGKKNQFDVQTGRPIDTYPDAAAIPDWKIYRDIMRGYEYQYPSEYLLLENLGYEGRPTGETSVKDEKTGWQVRISVEDYARSSVELQRSPLVSFEQFVIDRIRLMNEADGCDSRSYAGDVVGKESYINPQNLQCLEIYLMGIYESYSENEETLIEKLTLGPFYAALISDPGQPYRALIFSLDREKGCPPEELEIVKNIFNTVTVVK